MTSPAIPGRPGGPAAPFGPPPGGLTYHATMGQVIDVRRISDRTDRQSWEWLRLSRPLTQDPRLILVRALCGCGWVVIGDPPTTWGSAAEHFRGHWDVEGTLPSMEVTEDAALEDETRRELAGDVRGHDV